MTDEKKSEPERTWPRPTTEPAKKKAAKKTTKKAAPLRAVRYVVAPGRALTVTGRIIDAGEAITADDVADLEALLKGGYVVKA
jgi:hypothetical protein